PPREILQPLADPSPSSEGPQRLGRLPTSLAVAPIQVLGARLTGARNRLNVIAWLNCPGNGRAEHRSAPRVTSPVSHRDVPAAGASRSRHRPAILGNLSISDAGRAAGTSLQGNGHRYHRVLRYPTH